MSTLEHLERFIEVCGSNKLAAERLHISPQQISNYLNNRGNPGARVREKLREAGYDFDVENITAKGNLSSPTYEQGYKDGVKAKEIEVVELKAKVEVLSQILSKLIVDEPEAKRTEDIQTTKYTDINDIKKLDDEIELSPVRISPRKPKSITTLKAAATPIVGGTNSNDQP